MDPNAFRQLALRELDAVFRFALSLTGRPEIAEDLVQETYLRALRSKTDFQLTDLGVRPYLFKILHNALNTRLGKERRQPGGLEDLTDWPQADVAKDLDVCNDLQNFNWEAVDGELKRAVEALPHVDRIVFLLCAVEGLRYREIAEVVGAPLGTVMSRLHRARHVLGGQLSKLAADRGFKATKAKMQGESKSNEEGLS